MVHARPQLSRDPLGGMSRETPPPIVAFARVLEYAAVARSNVPPRDFIYIGGQLITNVGWLVVGQDLRNQLLLLIRCTAEWEYLASTSPHTAAEAKQDAERCYPGVELNWVMRETTSEEEAAFLQEVWQGLVCSFCGLTPIFFDALVSSSDGVNICNQCVARLRREAT